MQVPSLWACTSTAQHCCFQCNTATVTVGVNYCSCALCMCLLHSVIVMHIMFDFFLPEAMSHAAPSSSTTCQNDAIVHNEIGNKAAQPSALASKYGLYKSIMGTGLYFNTPWYVTSLCLCMPHGTHNSIKTYAVLLYFQLTASRFICAAQVLHGCCRLSHLNSLIHECWIAVSGVWTCYSR